MRERPDPRTRDALATLSEAFIAGERVMPGLCTMFLDNVGTVLTAAADR